MQRSSVTEYIVSDIRKSFKAEETAAQYFSKRIIKIVKRSIKKQQHFLFTIPPHKLTYKPYDVSKCARMVVLILKALGIKAVKIGDNKVEVSVEVDIRKMLSTYESTIARNISSEIAFDYERIGVISREKKERIYEENRKISGFGTYIRPDPMPRPEPPIVVRPKSAPPPRRVEELTLDAFFDSDSDTGTMSQKDSSSVRSASFDDFVDL